MGLPMAGNALRPTQPNRWQELAVCFGIYVKEGRNVSLVGVPVVRWVYPALRPHIKVPGMTRTHQQL